MTLRIPCLLVGFLALGLIVGYDIRSVRLLHERHLALEEARAAHSRYAAELRRLEGELGAAGGSSRPGRTGAGLPTGQKGAKLIEARGDLPLSARMILARDPSFAARYLDAYKAGLEARYGLEFRRLGLSPDDEDKLRGLLVDMEGLRLKVAQIAADQGVDMYDPSMDATRNATLRPDKTAIKQILTPDQYSGLVDYNSQYSLVSTIQTFAGNPAVSTVSTEQAEALLPVLAGASERDSDGEVVSHTINIDAALTGASSILTPDQLAVFSAVLKQSEAEDHLWRTQNN